MAAATCVARFEHGPDAAARLATLKKSDSYGRGDLLARDGWVTMPGDTSPVTGAGDICAQEILSADRATASKG